MRLTSLGLKVLTAYVAGALLSIALAVAGAVWMVQHDVLADLELRERAASLAAHLRFGDDGEPVAIDVDAAGLGWLYQRLPDEIAYRVLDASGRTVLQSRAGDAFWPPAAAGTDGRREFSFERGGSRFFVASERIARDGRQWQLQFATSERLMMLLQHKFALPYLGVGIGIFSAVLIVAFGLCAYLTLRHALRPLREISDAAMAISPQSLDARLRSDDVPAEISPLVDSFNMALERLEHGYRVQQAFLADAAHELKTPLALIRAQIELHSDDSAQAAALLADVEYMSRQVQQLLHLAEASERRNYAFVDVALIEVVHEATAYLERMAAAAGVRIELPGDDAAHALPWRADRGALFTMLKNLLENAIQHAPAGSEVHVEIGAQTLAIRDFGAGASQAQLAQMFGRFWRGQGRRDLGAGLGLSICHEIAQAHGWTLSAARAEPGLRFTLSRAPGA